MRFQSFFMSTTVQPLATASSHALSSLPIVGRAVVGPFLEDSGYGASSTFGGPMKIRAATEGMSVSEYVLR
jgi:hypothetical protein